MKVFIFLLMWSTACMAETALPSKSFETQVIEQLSSNKILKIEIATAVFNENSYYELQGIVSLEKGSQAEAIRILSGAGWHNSKHVVTKRESRSAILLYLSKENGIGLLSSDRIESGCFDYIEFSKIDNKLFITQLLFRETVETNKKRSESFQRVLIVPEWTKLSDAARNERLKRR